MILSDSSLDILNKLFSRSFNIFIRETPNNSKMSMLLVFKEKYSFNESILNTEDAYNDRLRDICSYIENDRVGVFNDSIYINLNRQILFTPKDVGKLKVDIAKKILKKINKKIKVSCFQKKISKQNIEEIISKFDIICDGSDNFETRYLVNDFCLKN